MSDPLTEIKNILDLVYNLDITPSTGINSISLIIDANIKENTE